MANTRATRSFTVRFTPEIYDRLSKLADMEKRSVGAQLEVMAERTIATFEAQAKEALSHGSE